MHQYLHKVSIFLIQANSKQLITTPLIEINKIIKKVQKFEIVSTELN